MGTLSSLFDLTRSSLKADQAALNATANNVANQNTVGYTRQVVSFQSGVSVTLSQGTQVAESGPTVTVSSKRDRVLEQRVQQGTQASAESGARADVYSDIENVFSVTGSSSTAGSTAIGTAVDAFFSSLTSLSSNPSDSSVRAGVVSAASSLASAFNTAATQLGSVQQSINGEVKNSVAQVNALTATIASLNTAIGETSPHGDAGTLEDQRQQAIAQLSQYVGLDQVTTESNGISLTTTGGTLLVGGNNAFALATTNVGGTTQVVDATGKDVSGTIAGGSVGGQLTAQNTDLPAVTNALDAVAYRVATAVNAQNEAGLDASGNAGGAIFTVTANAAGAAAAITVAATSGDAVAAAGVGEGSLGTTNANALAALASGRDAKGATISSEFAGLLGNVGTSSAAVQEQSTAQSATLTQLTTQRDSLSGVSLDEEASNLTEYQQAYEAASKVFSIVSELLTDSINLGSEQTYS